MTEDSIQSGGDGDSGYVVYPDGTMIVWRLSTTVSTTTNSNGSLYYNDHNGVALDKANTGSPYNFIQTPNCLFSIKHISQICWATQSPNLNTATTAYPRIVGATATGQANARVTAIGRWK